MTDITVVYQSHIGNVKSIDLHIADGLGLPGICEQALRAMQSEFPSLRPSPKDYIFVPETPGSSHYQKISPHIYPGVPGLLWDNKGYCKTEDLPLVTTLAP